MDTQAAWILAGGLALAGIFSGGIYQTVPAGVGESRNAVAVFVTNRFTGQTVFCNGVSCIPEGMTQPR